MDSLGLEAAGLIAIGFLMLAIGGELIVRGGAAAATRFGVSPVMIGIVLLGFGTSAPELFTSVQAALDDAPGIALGNVVGSNIANILLIAGVAALLTGAAATDGLRTRDGVALAAATAILCVVLWFDAFDFWVGAGFFAALVIYLSVSVYTARADYTPDVDAPKSIGIGAAILLFLAGLAATLFGAQWLVDGAITLATQAGLSQALIGATIVAIGTSLPELAATIAAAIRNRSDLAIGNVLGSNIFNIFGIAGVTAMVAPLPVPDEISKIDMWVMAAATVVLLVFAHSRQQLSRSEGVILLAGYAGFIAMAIYGSQMHGPGGV